MRRWCWLAGVLVLGCQVKSTPDDTACAGDDECVEGRVCVDGHCQLPDGGVTGGGTGGGMTGGGGGSLDAGSDGGADAGFDGGADAGSDGGSAPQVTLRFTAECVGAAGCAPVVVTLHSAAGEVPTTVSDRMFGSVGWSAVPSRLSVTLPDGGEATELIALRGACAGAQQGCSFTPTTNLDVQVVLGPRSYVFVSSLTHDGALGGSAGGDALCQACASDAGLPGTYRAWLSSVGAGPLAHANFASSSAGLVRTDGRVFARDLAFPDFMPVYLPSLDEHGQALDSGTEVWTGGDEHGDAVLNSCADWSSDAPASAGAAGQVDRLTWSYNSNYTCNTAHAFLCLRVDSQAPVLLPIQSGRTVFLSSGVNPRAGLAAIDAQCNADAAATGLQGDYRALLATTSTSAAERFDAGLPWVRPDGALAISDLDGGGALLPLNQLASGASQGTLAGVQVITGATSPTVRGTLTCLDWSSTSGQVNGATGDDLAAGPAAFNNSGNSSCDTVGLRVYCLQR